MNRCTLCTNHCVFQLFGKKKSTEVLLPNIVMCLLYGLPLMLVLGGAVLGALHSEILSILGAICGLILAFLSLRACQKTLNRLSLCTSNRSGDHLT